ncbi:T9SS type A sorting domain-containing protein [Saprospira sp. CCB-QB6]|uniref:T9SS type A sorting domain-containing protein n=1 Tax=Saprospira sp. CCB-QB6 TaxID=3023936 RepID=UPI00234BC26A|nr:T9SS type A sorting domain-containing protein [Saprospira sp. CCB-QB6]WCL81860.1 T9SS type A sorting domain-containing protein [Saprospira sp. CCB-QB6]
MMKQLLLYFFLLLTIGPGLFAQQAVDFRMWIEPVDSFSQIPALQSYVIGHHNNKWLVMAGRIDGLHQRQPNASFSSSEANNQIYVIDPEQKTFYAAPLTALPTSYQEQLSSTNLNYIQKDSTLYICGGYGYSATAQDHVTYPYLLKLDISACMQEVMQSQTVSSQHFMQLQDTAFAITGGQLNYIDSTFYLVGGHFFGGRYNPQGPTHGPGFTQYYSDAIRSFSLSEQNGQLQINNYQEQVDSANLHRRDYNLVPQVFPNGEEGFTIFTGVFQHQVDLPWLNTVDIDAQGNYTVRPVFEQLLNQYQTARLPIYEAHNNSMHTFFYGGIAQYYFDANGQLMNDPNVPFVKTISQVSRFANDSMQEYELVQKMPAFLGVGAEFIPQHSAFRHNGILELDQLPIGPNLVGYIYGGIESDFDNIFFINDGSQSRPSTQLFKVYVERDSALYTAVELVQDDLNIGLRLAPNPTVGQLQLSFQLAQTENLKFAIYNNKGQLVWEEKASQFAAGQQQKIIQLPAHWPAGSYYLELQLKAGQKTTLPFVFQP